ncbi:hypothetical protein KI387_030654, partial [Taxus chinensis]
MLAEVIFYLLTGVLGINFTRVIFNPRTKQHMVLPDFPLLLGWCLVMAIELIAESDHFRSLLSSKDVMPSKVIPLLYNSGTNKRTKSIPIAISSRFNSHPWASTVHNSVVYCSSSYGFHLGSSGIACDEFKFMKINGGLTLLVDCLDYAVLINSKITTNNERSFDLALDNSLLQGNVPPLPRNVPGVIPKYEMTWKCMRNALFTCEHVGNSTKMEVSFLARAWAYPGHFWWHKS